MDVKLKEKAASWMGKRPNIQLFFATSDGIFWNEENKNDALKHAAGRKEELIVFKRSDFDLAAAAEKAAPSPKGKQKAAPEADKAAPNPEGEQKTATEVVEAKVSKRNKSTKKTEV